MASLIAFGHNSLEAIKQRIASGHARAVRGGAEWVEGSLEVAAALREGRDAMPADVSFSGWLKREGLEFYNANARAALIHFGEDIELARQVLTETASRSYELIWAQHKRRFTRTRKPTAATARGRAAPNMGRAMLHREMKLGASTIAALKGTSLDNAEELDELVMLNRGAAAGEHTDAVKGLVAAAIAGELVSAIAEGAKMGGKRSSAQHDLASSWKRRMVAAWKLANAQQRVQLLEHLIADLDPLQQRLLLAKLTKTQGAQS